MYKDTDANPRPTGSLWLKTTTANLGQKFQVKKWNDTTKLWETDTVPVYDTNEAAIYDLDRTGGGVNLLTGKVYMKSNVADATDPLGTFTLFRRNSIYPTTITGSAVTTATFNGKTGADKTFTMAATAAGSSAFSSSVIVTMNFTGTATTVSYTHLTLPTSDLV